MNVKYMQWQRSNCNIHLAGRYLIAKGMLNTAANHQAFFHILYINASCASGKGSY